MSEPTVAVVVPIRAFLLGKSRLGGVLGAPERATFVRHMAETVVAAAQPYPVVIVSSAPEVCQWAAGHGLALLDDPGSLDGAAAAGVAWAAARRIRRAVVVHADLPFARRLDHVAAGGSQPLVTAVPCRRDDGTTVLSLPTAGRFAFAYGPGSFRRHAGEARRRGLGFRVVRDPDLARDVDRPGDLEGVPAVAAVRSA